MIKHNSLIKLIGIAATFFIAGNIAQGTDSDVLNKVYQELDTFLEGMYLKVQRDPTLRPEPPLKPDALETEKEQAVKPDALKAEKEQAVKQVVSFFDSLFDSSEHKAKLMEIVRTGTAAIEFNPKFSNSCMRFIKKNELTEDQIQTLQNRGYKEITTKGSVNYFIKIIIINRDPTCWPISVSHEIGHLIQLQLSTLEVPPGCEEDMSKYCEYKILKQYFNDDNNPNKKKYQFSILCSNLMGIFFDIAQSSSDEPSSPDESLSSGEPSSPDESPSPDSWRAFCKIKKAQNRQKFLQKHKYNYRYSEINEILIDGDPNQTIRLRPHAAGAIHAVRLLQSELSIDKILATCNNLHASITLKDIRSAVIFLQKLLPNEDK